MSQIIRKRRFTAMETAVLGNILYLILVAIFKAVIDFIGRDGNFNYIFNGVEFAVIGFFWIGLFANNFKKIYAGEKPRYFKYIFFCLIPIVLLTGALILVSLFVPGTVTSTVWNQFSFIAAPTIFWYLPFGIIYELIGEMLPIYAFYGVCLGMTVVFQVIGIMIGRSVGRKYWRETKEEAKKEESLGNNKQKRNKRETVVVEGIPDKDTFENKEKPKKEKVQRAPIILDETPEALEKELQATEKAWKEKSVEMYEEPKGKEEADLITEVYEEIDEAYGSELFSTLEKNPETAVEVKQETVVKREITEEDKKITDWEMTLPIDVKKIQEALEKPDESFDKSFFMETSQIRIINEEDIEEYYRNKK